MDDNANSRPMTPSLCRQDVILLQALEHVGGGAEVRDDGRLIRAAQTNSRGKVTHLPVPLPGGAAEWWRLCAMGLIGGEFGKLIITEQGRECLRNNSFYPET